MEIIMKEITYYTNNKTTTKFNQDYISAFEIPSRMIFFLHFNHQMCKNVI